VNAVFDEFCAVGACGIYWCTVCVCVSSPVSLLSRAKSIQNDFARSISKWSGNVDFVAFCVLSGVALSSALSIGRCSNVRMRRDVSAKRSNS
jgi:hypothetical protein